MPKHANLANPQYNFDQNLLYAACMQWQLDQVISKDSISIQYHKGVAKINDYMHPVQIIGCYNPLIMSWQNAHSDIALQQHKIEHVLETTKLLQEIGKIYNDPLFSYRECLPIGQHDLHWLLCSAMSVTANSIACHIPSKFCHDEYHLCVINSPKLCEQLRNEFNNNSNDLTNKLMAAWSNIKPVCNLLLQPDQALQACCKRLGLSYQSQHGTHIIQAGPSQSTLRFNTTTQQFEPAAAAGKVSSNPQRIEDHSLSTI